MDETTDFQEVNWLLTLNGMADAFIVGFDAGAFRLRCRQPAYGRLGILGPEGADSEVTVDDARWLADAIAYDHDAPIGIRPAIARSQNRWESSPRISDGETPIQPIVPIPSVLTDFYWDAVAQSLDAAATLRFNESFRFRYFDPDETVHADFATRFSKGRQRVRLYAMATRQADVLSEYLCLYRLLEAADGTNGKTFASECLDHLDRHDFGNLEVVNEMRVNGDHVCTNVFEMHRLRAMVEIYRLEHLGTDIPKHLYALRNGLAHGKKGTIAHGQTEFERVARALPIVKLMARLSVSPDSPDRGRIPATAFGRA